MRDSILSSGMVGGGNRSSGKPWKEACGGLKACGDGNLVQRRCPPHGGRKQTPKHPRKHLKHVFSNHPRSRKPSPKRSCLIKGRGMGARHISSGAHASSLLSLLLEQGRAWFGRAFVVLRGGKQAFAYSRSSLRRLGIHTQSAPVRGQLHAAMGGGGGMRDWPTAFWNKLELVARNEKKRGARASKRKSKKSTTMR